MTFGCRSKTGVAAASALLVGGLSTSGPALAQPRDAAPAATAAETERAARARDIQTNRAILAALEQRRAAIVARRAEFRTPSDYDEVLAFIDRQIKLVREDVPAAAPGN